MNTVKLIFAEGNREAMFGVNTSKFVRSESAEYFHYQGASYLVLQRVLSEIIKETKGFDFVDIGSGMGRAVFVAEYCGYNSLLGIELNEELNKLALGNIEKYKFKRKESQINFVHRNALDYPYKNESAVYFLFNPFNADILRQVLTRIKKSTDQETFFVYMNPLYSAVFDGLNIRSVRVFKSGFYTEAIVYRLN